MMTACSSHPSELAVRLTEAANAGDYEYVLDNSITSDGKKLTNDEKEQLATLLNAQSKELLSKHGTVENIKVLKETIASDGLNATVKLRIVYNDGDSKEEICKLQRVKGKWQYVLP